MKQLATPDPVMTTEQVVAAATALIAAVVVLFKLNVSDAQQGALVTIIASVYAAFTLYHASRVRAGRAIGNASSSTTENLP